jgi:sugar O-acyltransferase (sialic acid O-acetyltransferase NeuD family)
MECVLYGVGSPFIEEVRETLRRLGWVVRGGVRNVETEFQPEGLEPIVGVDEIPSEWHDLAVVLPFVTPGHRHSIELEARARGFRHFPSIVDPTVILPEHPSIGEGTFVGAGCMVGAMSVLGRQICFNRAVTIGHHARIEDYAAFGPAAILCGLVTVERGAFVGAGALLGPNVTVGSNAVVGAGSVVLRDVAPNSVVVGNPARLIREGIVGYNDVGVPA